MVQAGDSGTRLAIRLLQDAAERGDIEPWDVDVIAVVDGFLDQLRQKLELPRLIASAGGSYEQDLAESSEAFLAASVLVLLVIIATTFVSRTQTGRATAAAVRKEAERQDSVDGVGEDIAQLLALIGVRPVWDGPTRRLTDLEVIPLTLLGRPRVDVVLRISGLFRDAFPQLVGWVEQAQCMVASLDESHDDNPLAALTRTEGEQPRIFGSAPGAYGAGLQALIDNGAWTERGDLGEAFLQWSHWRYDGSANPVKDLTGLQSALGRVEVVLQNQDNREHDLLDSDDYYQFQGGLSAAVEAISGNRPQLWFADHSRRERPRIHTLERELDKVMRSRLLNPRWLKGMQEHGYKGAFEMGASLDYLFAYDAATGRVPDWSYGAICEQWLNDPEIVEFLASHNPWVLRDMAERLLEAANRGLWSSQTPQQRNQLKELVGRSEALVERGGFTC